MSAKKNTERDEYQSDGSTTYQLASESGDRLVVAISPTGLTMIQAETFDENTILGLIVVSGLTPQQAVEKSKGFWGKLWDKIKGAVEDVIDAFTFDAGPFTCRPTAKVGFQDDKLISVTIGVSCKD